MRFPIRWVAAALFAAAALCQTHASAADLAAADGTSSAPVSFSASPWTVASSSLQPDALTLANPPTSAPAAVRSAPASSPAAPSAAAPTPAVSSTPSSAAVSSTPSSTAAPPAPSGAFGANTADLTLNQARVATPATAPTENLGSMVVRSPFETSVLNIAPPLGAQSYTIGPSQIDTIPEGDNAPLQQALLTAPGVVPDSFGQEHVRGEHGNLTYRVNGVLLPEPLNGFGQELDTRLIQSMSLIDGTLPAQFGFHTAAIVDITTKSGSALQNNELSLYGGSYDTFNPSVQVGGVDGKLDYFITAQYLHNDLGIENPTSSHRPLHDYTDQERAFGYFSYHIDDTSRISLLLNGYEGDFQIPNTPYLPPTNTLAGVNNNTLSSGAVNENQNEQEYYSVVSYQKAIDNFSMQLSTFSRFGQIAFKPDPVGDLVFQGVAGQVTNGFITNGVQLDSSYVLNDQHTLRAGFLVDYTQETLETNTLVFVLNNAGMQASDIPRDIGANSSNQAWQSGVYIQDEWTLTPKLTLNYGLRYDRFDANFDTEDQVSPRVNLVYKIDSATTAHAGYANYVVPPPIQDMTTATLKKFEGTTNASEVLTADPPKVERSNYYDTGISHEFSKAWTVDVDGFYKQAQHLVDLGQFGDAVILAPYNYSSGEVYGSELSTTYHQGGLSTYANFSWVATLAHDIDSQQFEFGSAELAYIQSHNIKLDHEGEYTISAGASYAWPHDKVYIDMRWGTGLRAGFANLQQEPNYYPVSVGYEHTIALHSGGKAIKFRIDVINVFDESYQIRNGSGLGVVAPQYGQRRTILAGITYAF